MAYTPPTLADLRTRVARDLRDPLSKAFSTDELDGYINGGIAALNELRPVEAKLVITDLDSLSGLGLDYIWRVDSIATNGYGENLIPPNNDESIYQNGWTYFADQLLLPQGILRSISPGFDAGTIALTIMGYRPRDPLSLPTDVAEFSLDFEEEAVSQYAKWQGLEALQNDRNLFQQWQTAANNTDVSPTQLTNMEQVAESEWSRTRKRIFSVRRPAVGW